MATVILFVLICVGLYILYVYFKKEEEKNKHYRELARFIDKKELYPEYARTNIKDIHPRFTKMEYKEPTADEIRKYFKEHPDKLAEVETRLVELGRNRILYQEERKRKLIKQRVFAYEYEDMLFQIFAPFAHDYGNTWVPQPLLYDFVVKRIAEIKNVTAEEASKILEALKDKEVIYYNGGVNLSQVLWDGSFWNIVSDTDLNLDKWMVAHGYEHKNN